MALCMPITLHMLHSNSGVSGVSLNLQENNWIMGI